MFVLVPLAALLVMGFTRRAHRTYIEHLYFTLHTHAALFAALTLAWLAERAFDGARDTVRTATLFVVAAYFWPALREAYGGGVILNTGRTLALSLLYLITLLAAVAAIVTLAVVLPS
jgi:hypothetical protein